MLHENMYYFANSNNYAQNEQSEPTLRPYTNQIMDKIRSTAYYSNNEFDASWQRFYNDSADYLSAAVQVKGFEYFGYENRVNKMDFDAKNQCKFSYNSCKSSQESNQEYLAPIYQAQCTTGQFEHYKLSEYGRNIGANDTTETRNLIRGDKRLPEIQFETYSSDTAEYCSDEPIEHAVVLNDLELTDKHQSFSKVYETAFVDQSIKNGE